MPGCSPGRGIHVYPGGASYSRGVLQGRTSLASEARGCPGYPRDARLGSFAFSWAWLVAPAVPH